MDPHVWLDPLNAKAMVRAIEKTLSDIDPRHAGQYQKNAGQMQARLDRLDQQLAAELKPVTDRPFMVFHDGYQYFEKRYHLKAVGSVVFQLDQASSAKRLRWLHQLIKEKGVVCVFAEPEFSRKKIDALIRGTDIRTGVLDPLGSALPPGPDQYFAMMTQLGQSAKSCLAGSSSSK